MNTSKAPYKIAILGGGISGLSAAYYLKKKWGSEVKVSLFESQSRVGGWIQTVEKDGYLFELGPHSLRVSEDDATIELIKNLGLEDQILYADSQANNRYLYLDGRLQKMPSSILSLLKHPLAKMVLPALCKEFFVPRATADETVAGFFGRRFSAQVVETLIDPLIKGIYGGDPYLLSMKCCFPKLVEMEKQYGSLIKGLIISSFKKKNPAKIISLKNGLGSLVKALEAQLKDIIQVSTPINRISFEQGKALLNDHLIFDRVVFTLPAFQISKLLQKPAANHEFHFASFAIVNFGFKDFTIPSQGFGYLVPSKEGQQILGSVFDSAIFPSQNLYSSSARITVMMGGWQQRGLVFLDDKQLYEIALQNLSTHFKQRLNPDTFLVSKLFDAVPQYFLAHQTGIENLICQYKSDPIDFIGNSFKGVSVGDCILQSKNLVDNFKINT